MDNENRKDMAPAGSERQIQLMVNHSEDDGTIDLAAVFYNMKRRRRLFVWVLVLCLTAGACLGLLWYQLTKEPQTVSSVVTLRYEAPVKVLKDKKDGSGQEWVVPDDPEYAPVSDLSAPDGSELDVNQIASSYVLQAALDGIDLPESVKVANLRSNIEIQTVLTEESRRTKEALAGLAGVKNADAYNQLKTAEMTYENRFVVTLKNGFGDEDSRVKTELTNAELKLLLDRILSAYNDYLVLTYADLSLPGDAFSVIDIQELDVADSLDLLRSGVDELYDYCDGKTDTVKAYRSAKTGRTLEDWMETLKTFKSINVDYLYAMVTADAVTRDKTALLTSWKYLLRTEKNNLDKVNGNIEETKKILAGYKNDEVFVSMQESDAAKTTKASSAYYNELIQQQMANYEKAAELETVIAEYTDRITRLEAMDGTAVTPEVEAELARSLSSAQRLYGQIREHMEELYRSPAYTTFEDHSAAQGEKESFLGASMKKIVIGSVLGLVIACGLWFLAALGPEFYKGKKEENGKGADAE